MVEVSGRGRGRVGVENGLCFIRRFRLSDRYRMKMKMLERCQVMASDKRTEILMYCFNNKNA